MKKLFLLFALLLGALSAWAVDVRVDGICYNLDKENKTASVTSGNGNAKGTIVIPKSISVKETTYSVTSLEDRCFYKCTGLTSITIPNSVTTI